VSLKNDLLSDSEKILLTLWIEKGTLGPKESAQQSTNGLASLATRKPHSQKLLLD
jgi:hypothetical protein